MHLFVIDPGGTTGIAEFVDGYLVDTWTSTAPHDELRRALRRTKLYSRPVVVVCEQGPVNHRRLAATCEDVEALVEHQADTIYWIRANQWKGHPRARFDEERNAVVSERFISRHERDAVRLGNWFLHTRGVQVAKELNHSAHATGSNPRAS